MKAALRGDIESQHLVGYHYHEGEVVKKDFKKSVYWYRLAAKHGDKYSQYNLGLCYKCGDGVGKDKKKAIKWLKLSAKQGYSKALKRIEDLKND